MPEPVTAVEKVEALYLLQIERLERQLADAREERERDRATLQRDYHERLKERVTEYHEQKQELLAQNDGMLGAVGRLHAENQTLRQQLAEENLKRKAIEANLERTIRDIEEIRERTEARVQEVTDRLGEDAAREIKDLKKQIEDLKGKTKKKA